MPFGATYLKSCTVSVHNYELSHVFFLVQMIIFLYILFVDWENSYLSVTVQHILQPYLSFPRILFDLESPGSFSCFFHFLFMCITCDFFFLIFGCQTLVGEMKLLYYGEYQAAMVITRRNRMEVQGFPGFWHIFDTCTCVWDNVCRVKK